ncbi:MAG TPA: glycosyltransferase family 9 protein [Gammaproteobacteria bacterium]|nr:glycosyltransferase family 9 protein [Gammaproteobacteria bacterium]
MTTPESVCVMRLSAVGDICHTLPVIRTLAAAWPDTRITWVIGRLEATLIGDIPGIEFIIFDKSQGRKAHRQLRRQLAGRHFDLLLHMQVSLRASIATLNIRARRRLGFDHRRARDFQWLFTNEKIAARVREHVMDGLFGFTDALGIRERVLRWDIPLSDADRTFAAEQIPAGTPTLIISPLANPRLRNWRNWSIERYAAVADYAEMKHGLRVILTGGPSAAEREVGRVIGDLCHTRPIDLIGKTTLKQLVALLQRATALVSPDSGPAHMGTAVGTPVIGLYATTNVERSGPYLHREWVVNRYPEALRRFAGTTPEEARWGMRVRHPEAMQLIQVADVTAMLDRVLKERGNRSES